MRKITFSIVLVLVTVLVNACGAQRTPPQPPPRPQTQMVTFNSEPQGARVVMNGQIIGTTPFMFSVPLTYHTATTSGASAAFRAGFGGGTVSNSFLQRTAEMNQTRFVFLQDGFMQGEEVFQPVVREGATGLHFDFPSAVFHILRPGPNAGQVAVTRDAPGATSLERTVIRWRFDSDPRGARISWRVISNVPEEVRNTNDTFLSTTPFEETRGFDILGLTYENAHNVTIEIRVERRGFFEQVRRFNVRQAIDQREISSFFELVPTD